MFRADMAPSPHGTSSMGFRAPPSSGWWSDTQTGRRSVFTRILLSNKQFAVAPADRVDVFGIAALEIPQTFPQPIGLTMPIKAGDILIGMNASGFAQRRITDMEQVPPLPENPPDPPPGMWEPASPDPAFYHFAWHILDVKSHEAGFPWDAVPVGSEYRAFTENLRLTYTAPCGEVKILPLGAVRLVYTKVDQTHWKISLGVQE